MVGSSLADHLMCGDAAGGVIVKTTPPRFALNASVVEAHAGIVVTRRVKSSPPREEKGVSPMPRLRRAVPQTLSAAPPAHQQVSLRGKNAPAIAHQTNCAPAGGAEGQAAVRQRGLFAMKNGYRGRQCINDHAQRGEILLCTLHCRRKWPRPAARARGQSSASGRYLAIDWRFQE